MRNRKGVLPPQEAREVIRVRVAGCASAAMSARCFLSRLLQVAVVAGLLAAPPLVRVAAGQTFGLTSTGSTGYPTGTVGTTSILGSTAEAQGTLSAQLITIPAGGATIQSVTIYWSTVGTGGQVTFAFYSDSSGNPGSLVAGSTLAPVAAIAGWQTITYSTPFHLSAGTYWLARQTSNNQIKRNYNLSGGAGRRTRSFTYGAFPDPYGSGNTSDTLNESQYITYVQIEGYAKATKATLSASGAIVSSVSFYSHAAGNFRVAIYSDSGGPTSKLWESGDTAATAGAWNTVNISAGTPTSLSLNAGTYWLAWQWNSATSGPSYTAGSSGDGNYVAQAYGSFPATWSGGTSSAEKYSIYATYAVAVKRRGQTVVGALLPPGGVGSRK